MSPLQIIIDPKYNSKVLDLKIWIRDGSRRDPPNKKGLHNLLASLLTRGCGHYKSNDFANIVEGFGAALRCYVNEDGILISLKCSEEDQLSLIPLIGMMITQPRLDIEQIKLEKELTMQQIIKNKESSFQLAYNNWRRIAYTQSNYQTDPIGIDANIQMINKLDLDILSQDLRNRESYMVVSGSVFASELKTILNNYDFNLLKQSTNKNNKELELGSMILSDKYNLKIVTEVKDTSQVVIMYGNPTTSHNSKDDLILKVISSHLGNGMSSILFKTLREDNAVSYDVGVYNPIREYKAPFVIHCSTTKDKASKTIELLNETITTLLTVKLTSKELNLAKVKLRGNYAHNSQTVSQRAERKAVLLGFRMEEDYDQKCIKLLDEINSDEIQRVAQKYLSKPIVSLCGPKETIDRIASNLSKKD